jgi:DNA repair exonuclease SbcCD ATPase subunit
VKIQSLELKNFRNHADTFMVFDKVNYIVGSNNSGKSTIKGAIQYSLTGETEWGSNKQSKDLIMYGKEEASTEVGIEILGLVKRTINNAGVTIMLNDNKLPARELEKEIYEDLKLTPEVINCVMDSSKFLDMKPSEQKDFLFRLTGAVLGPEQIIDYMNEPSEEAKEKVLKVVGPKVTIEMLDGVYKAFYDERRYKKKEKERLEKGLELMGGVPPVVDEMELLKLEKLLEAATTEREELMRKAAVINEQIKQKKWLEESLKEVEEKIKTLDEKLDKSIVSDAEEALFGYVTEMNSLEKEIEACRATYNSLNGENKSLKAMLPRLSTTRCPLSERLVCKTDKSSLIKELEAQIEANEKEIANLKDKESSLQKQYNALKEKKENLEQQIDLYAKMEELQKNKEKIVKILSSIKIEDESKLNKEVEKCDKEIRELDARRQTYNEQVKARKEYENLKREFDKVSKEVELYEYLVSEFSPKGVKQRILKKIIDPIQDHCNKILSILTGSAYSLRFSFDENFDILIKNRSGEVSYRMLSNSEKLRLAIVLQDAINNLTNAGVLFVDNAEILDETNFDLFKQLISKIKDNYESIFVITTGDKTSAGLLKGDDAKVFYIEDGNVSEV